MRKPVAVALTLPLLAAPLVATVPASAQSVVKEAKLERNIKKGFKQKANITVTVNCPSNVTWVNGKQFYCKARSTSGTKYRVRVTLHNESTGYLTWKVVS